jgi:hypothetical protein
MAAVPVRGTEPGTTATPMALGHPLHHLFILFFISPLEVGCNICFVIYIYGYIYRL